MYQWDQKEIKDKLNYVNARLKHGRLTEQEIKELFLTRVSLVEMLQLFDGIHLKVFSNIKEGFLEKKYFLSNKKLMNGLKQDLMISIDNSELKFSFELCKNLALGEISSFVLEQKKMTKKDCVITAFSFLDQFPNEKIRKELKTILKDEKKIQLGEKKALDRYQAVTYHLPFFKEGYIFCPKEPTLLLHEAVHAYHFKENSSIGAGYLYSDEVPTYAIQFYCCLLKEDFSFIDDIKQLSKNTINKACTGAVNPFPPVKIENFTYQNMINPTMDVIENLLTIKSMLIASCLAKDIYETDLEGGSHFEEIFYTQFSKDRKPDYRKWGIDQQRLLSVSKNLKEEFINLKQVRKL